MPSDEQFTALGKSDGITAVGFQTFWTSIAVGVDASGIQAGVIGKCTKGNGVHGISASTKAAVLGENLSNGNTTMDDKNNGVEGMSDFGDGIFGISSSKGRAGVHGKSKPLSTGRSLGDGVVGEIGDREDNPNVFPPLVNAGIHGKVFPFDNSKKSEGDAILGEVKMGPSVAIHGISYEPDHDDQGSGTAVFGENKGVGVGVSGSSVSGVAVLGNSKNGTAVRGISTGGIGGVFEGKKSPLQLRPQEGSIWPPQQDEFIHEMGEFHLTQKGELFFCIATGSPGTWKRVSLI